MAIRLASGLLTRIPIDLDPQAVCRISGPRQGEPTQANRDSTNWGPLGGLLRIIEAN